MAAFPFSTLSPRAPLISSRLALGVEKIGNGGTAHRDGFPQNFLQRATQSFGLLLVQPCSELRRMNLRPPQAFVGINVADAAQHALIQKQRFDARAPPANSFHKLLFAD